ncbi:PREDICTED: uncharacterized protein LOC109583576 isoform X1 [Amphimedon queenslandica]|uniref:ZU5 domain-containing protein n=1 Tax=Amphimedon queenslandica TaxID=400682 RepID=A0AAN0JC04_AMPQE|nr:PREDICTED: uncharacterized protein LOC109583576 isoform X1 [Amphimedon queenslandica]|eukprot:XP_019854550.1 PREDICTED: uncharacterized protein LOC109583576 isoform X1 [Amphimedon queenslandica]
MLIFIIILAGLAKASPLCLSLCTIFYCCLTLSCIAIVIFLGIRNPVAGPTTSLQVGDILSNSSALIKANYSVSSATFFMLPEGTVYVTATEPPKITDHLPPKHLSVGSIRYDLNYLGLVTPIYLLPGSILHYNVSITSNERLDSSYSACLYLFTSLTRFQNFLSFVENDNSSNMISYCFTSPVTPRQPTLASHSFDIVEASKYYVGVELVSGVNVIMMANVSVVRVYYDTRGLSPHCNMVQFCYIDICDELLCSHSSSSATYILVQAPADSSIQYEITTAALFGANYAYFLLALSLGNFSFCCCFICYYCCCIALRSLSIDDSSEGRNYSRLKNYDDSEFENSSHQWDHEESNANQILRNFSEFEQSQLTNYSEDSSEHDNSGFENSPQQCEESRLTNLSEDVEKNYHDNPECKNSIIFSQFSEHVPLTHHVEDVELSTVSSSDSLISEWLETHNETTESYLSINSNFITGYEIDGLNQLREEKEPDLQLVDFSAETHCYLKNHGHQDTSLDSICTLDTRNDPISVAADIFGDVVQIPIDRSGLVHHCSQYGVTLIIPEGAVQESATVWFGACLFSDKFKFGDYVPVTPIVWVHIDAILHKPAELYFPHDIVISSEADLEKFSVLTADDKGHSSILKFYQKCHSPAVEACLKFLPVFKIECQHFCSNCVAIHNRQYKRIAKRYLMARAEKSENNCLTIEFIFLCLQQGCKKMIEGQCAKQGFTITSYKTITFTGDGQVSLSLEPDSFDGWKQKFDDLHSEYISEKSIDYYEIMGCEKVGEVTEDELERLDLLEEALAYPPRFRLIFTRDGSFGQHSNQEVTVTFNQVDPPLVSKIYLEGHGAAQPLSPASSSTNSQSFSIDTDQELGEMIHIITSENFLKEKWYTFGYHLKLETDLLNEIETTCTNPNQCTRRVILHWRGINKPESGTDGYTSWEPVATALTQVGLNNLARKIKRHFNPPIEPEATNQGVYCSLCNEYHGDGLQQHASSTISILNSSPDISQLTNLVAAKIEDKYFLFGTAVGLNIGYINGLGSDYRMCKERFIQVLYTWSNSKPNEFTWDNVIKALRSDTVDAAEVALDVEDHLFSKTK